MLLYTVHCSWSKCCCHAQISRMADTLQRLLKSGSGVQWKQEMKLGVLTKHVQGFLKVSSEMLCFLNSEMLLKVFVPPVFLLPSRLSKETLLRSSGAATPTVKGLLAMGSPPNFTTIVISPCRYTTPQIQHFNSYSITEVCGQTTGGDSPAMMTLNLLNTCCNRT